MADYKIKSSIDLSTANAEAKIKALREQAKVIDSSLNLSGTATNNTRKRKAQSKAIDKYDQGIYNNQVKRLKNLKKISVDNANAQKEYARIQKKYNEIQKKYNESQNVAEKRRDVKGKVTANADLKATTRLQEARIKASGKVEEARVKATEKANTAITKYNLKMDEARNKALAKQKTREAKMGKDSDRKMINQYEKDLKDYFRLSDKFAGTKKSNKKGIDSILKATRDSAKADEAIRGLKEYGKTTGRRSSVLDKYENKFGKAKKQMDSQYSEALKYLNTVSKDKVLGDNANKLIQKYTKSQQALSQPGAKGMVSSGIYKDTKMDLSTELKQLKKIQATKDKIGKISSDSTGSGLKKSLESELLKISKSGTGNLAKADIGLKNINSRLDNFNKNEKANASTMASYEKERRQVVKGYTDGVRQLKTIGTGTLTGAEAERTIKQYQNKIAKASIEGTAGARNAHLIAQDMYNPKMDYDNLRRMNTVENRVNSLPSHMKKTLTRDMKLYLGDENLRKSGQLHGEIDRIGRRANLSEKRSSKMNQTLDRMKSSFFGNFMGRMGYNAVWTAASGISDHFKSLDASYTNLKKVADPSFLNTEKKRQDIKDYSSKTAIDVGQLSSDVMQAVSDAVQVGFNDPDTAKYVARKAMILSNVGEISQEQASSGINMITKGFQLTPTADKQIRVGKGVKNTTELGNIADMVNYIGNNYAIKTSGVLAAISRNASVDRASGMDIESSLAMNTAIAEVTQDAERTGTGIKTLISNIQGLSTSAKDGTIKFNKTATALDEIANVDIYKNKEKGETKTPTEILEEVKTKWGGLADDQRKALSVAIAGSRRGDIFQALMSNWGTFENIRSEFKSGKQFGSAEEENKKYVESLAGKSNKLKETLYKSVDDMVNSDTVYAGLDSLTGILSGFGKMADLEKGLTGSALSLPASLIGGYKGLRKVFKPNADLVETDSAHKNEIARQSYLQSAESKAGKQTEKTQAQNVATIRSNTKAVKNSAKVQANNTKTVKQSIVATNTTSSGLKANNKTSLSMLDVARRNQSQTPLSPIQTPVTAPRTLTGVSDLQRRYLDPKQATRMDKKMYRRDKIGTIMSGVQGLAGGMVLGGLVGAGVDLGFKAISKGYEEMTSHIKNSVNENKSELITLKDKTKGYQQQAHAIEQLQPRFEELEKKKFELNKTNEKLNASDEAELNNLKLRLSQTDPSLSTGLDENGNVVVPDSINLEDVIRNLNRQENRSKINELGKSRELNSDLRQGLFEGEFSEKIGNFLEGKGFKGGILNALDERKIAQTQMDLIDKATTQGLSHATSTDFKSEKQYNDAMSKTLSERNAVLEKFDDSNVQLTNNSIEAFKYRERDRLDNLTGKQYDAFQEAGQQINFGKLSNTAEGNKILKGIMSKTGSDADSVTKWTDRLQQANEVYRDNKDWDQYEKLMNPLIEEGSKMFGGTKEEFSNALMDVRRTFSSLEEMNKAEFLKKNKSSLHDLYSGDDQAGIASRKFDTVSDLKEYLASENINKKTGLYDSDYIDSLSQDQNLPEILKTGLDYFQKGGFDKSEGELINNLGSLYQSNLGSDNVGAKKLNKILTSGNVKDALAENTSGIISFGNGLKLSNDEVLKLSNMIDSLGLKPTDVLGGILEPDKMVAKLTALNKQFGSLSDKAQSQILKGDLDKDALGTLEETTVESRLWGTDRNEFIERFGSKFAGTHNIQEGLNNLTNSDLITSGFKKLNEYDSPDGVLQKKQSFDALPTEVRTKWKVNVDKGIDFDSTMTKLSEFNNQDFTAHVLAQLDGQGDINSFLASVNSIPKEKVVKLVAKYGVDETQKFSEILNQSGLSGEQKTQAIDLAVNGDLAISKIHNVAELIAQLKESGVEIEINAEGNAPEKTEEVKEKIDGIPKKKTTKLTANDGASGPAKKVERATSRIPEHIKTNLKAEGNAEQKAKKTAKAVNDIPGDKPVSIKVAAQTALSITGQLVGLLNSVSDRTAHITIYHTIINTIKNIGSYLFGGGSSGSLSVDGEDYSVKQQASPSSGLAPSVNPSAGIGASGEIAEGVGSGVPVNSTPKGGVTSNLKEIQKFLYKNLTILNKSKLSVKELNDSLKNEVDVYRELDAVLGRIDKKVSLLESQSKHMNAGDKYLSIKEQNDYLREGVRRNDAGLNLYEQQRDSLKYNLRDNGYKFDSTGGISNLLKKTNQYKDRLEQIDKESEKAKDKKKDDLDKEAKNINKRLDWAEQYLSLIQDKIPNAQQKTIDYENKIYENSLDLKKQLLDKLETNMDLALAKSTKQLKAIDNAMSLNDTKMKYTHGYDKLDLMDKQAENYQNAKAGYAQQQADYLKSIRDAKKELSKNGFEFGEGGVITNYEGRLRKLNDTSELYKELKSLADSYEDTLLKKVPDTIRMQEEYNNKLMALNENRLTQTKSIEDTLVKLYKENIKKKLDAMRKQTKEEVDEINKQKKAYSEARADTNYQDQYALKKKEYDKTKKIMDIYGKDSSQAGQKKYQEYKDRLEVQERDLTNLVNNHIDTTVNRTFDKAIEKKNDFYNDTKENYDDKYTDTELLKMAQEGIKTGIFTDIDGQTKALKTALVDYINEFQGGLGATGAIIQAELLDKLDVAKDTVSDFADILNNLDLNKYNSGGYIQYDKFKDIKENNIKIENNIELSGDISDDNLEKFKSEMEKIMKDTIKQIENNIN